jgi:putative inorganic carbon (hco3(-)) transporter
MINTTSLSYSLFDRKIILASFVVIVCAVVSGVLISFGMQFIALGLLGMLTFIFLSFSRPFIAFLLFVFFAITVWFSSVKVVGNVSVLVVIGLVFSMIWLIRLASQKTVIVQVKEYWYLISLTAVLILSTIANQSSNVGIQSAFTYLQLYVLFVLTVNFVRTVTQLKWVVYVLIISSTFLAISVLLGQLGWLSVEIARITSEYLSGTNRETINRASGFWGDPNFTALQLLVALPFIFEIIPNTRGVLRRILLIISAVTIMMSIVFTYSTGGFVGFFTIIIAKILLINNGKNIKSRVFQVGLFILIIGVGATLLPETYVRRLQIKLVLPTNLLQNPERDSLFLDMGTGRGDTWQGAWQAAKTSPLLGNGPGASEFANAQFSLIRETDRRAAHNMFLAVASELGFMAATIFLILIASAIFSVRPKQIYGNNYTELRGYANAIFVFFIAYIAQGLALDAHNMKVLWIMLGVAVAYRRLDSLLIDTYQSLKN